MDETIGDLLLRWMSEIGNGSIADLRNRIDWIARTDNIEPRPYTSGRWLRDLSLLAHCEVNWSTGHWSVAPPALVRVPSAGGLAVVVGARRPRTMRLLEDFCGSLAPARRVPTDGEVPLPTTFYMSFRSQTDLLDACAETGLEFAGDAAERISAALPAIQPHVAAAPPAYTSELWRLEAMQPREWRQVRAAQKETPDGLYSEKVHGRQRYMTRRDGMWFKCDLSTGVFAELYRRSESVLRWRRDSGRQIADTGTLFVDWGAPLPPLHGRALVLCSGLPPKLGTIATTAIYENVPRIVAARICGSLGQPLLID